ncbi:MAG: histidine kinase [Lachnospiraceae bacterium]|nr:histidine kinase [Lachnospiraceae bacterium]
MEKKIFKSIFLVALGVLVISTLVFASVLNTYYMDKEVLKVLGVTSYALMLSILQPVSIILVGILIAATVVASNVAKKIVEPINSIDVDNLENNEMYEEIKPLISKIGKQARQLQRQIKDAEQKQVEFNTIMEHMSEGILIIDTKYEVLSYNKAIVDLFTDGIEPSSNSVFAFNKNKKFKKMIKKTFEGKQREKVIEIKERSYMVISNPVYEENRIVGAIIIVMDVTEKEKRDSFRREFTANVSHELKTPLTSISGFAEIMKSGIVKAEDMPEMANSIYEEAARLITLVNDIIKLSALDDENMSYESIDVNLCDLVKEINDRLATVIAKKEIDFNIKVENDELIINSPKQIVSEMLYNLCDNAIKYNKVGGMVQVEIWEDNKYMHIAVKDTGIGIEPEYHDRIFERFYRVDKSHSKEVGGTGLGLSIVKHDVSYLSGNIEVSSKIGEGTCIQVNIPK